MTPEELQHAWPAWNIWRSKDDKGNPGWWWANRRNEVLSTDEMYAGLMHSLAEDSGEELEAALEAQADLRKRYDDEQQAAAGKPTGS